MVLSDPSDTSASVLESRGTVSGRRQSAPAPPWLALGLLMSLRACASRAVLAAL